MHRNTRGSSRPTIGRQIAGREKKETSEYMWNVDAIGAYRNYIMTAGPPLVNTNFISDCADLSLTLLIQFARQRILPVSFKKSTQRFYDFPSVLKFKLQYGEHLSKADTTGDYDKLLDVARTKIGATHLYYLEQGNTIGVPLMQLRPGDMLVGEPHNAPGSMHVQVALSSPKNTIRVVDLDKDKVQAVKKQGKPASDLVREVQALEILQGSLEVDDNGSPIGTKIMHKAWGVKELSYYIPASGVVEATIKNTFKLEGSLWTQTAEKIGAKSPFGSDPGMFPRRWNFYGFNARKRNEIDESNSHKSGGSGYAPEEGGDDLGTAL